MCGEWLLVEKKNSVKIINRGRGDMLYSILQSAESSAGCFNCWALVVI